MTTAHAGWWRPDRRVQRPTSDVPGRRGAVAAVILGSNRPLACQARLLEPEAVGGP
jgi:hypothetical protein